LPAFDLATAIPSGKYLQALEFTADPSFRGDTFAVSDDLPGRAEFQYLHPAVSSNSVLQKRDNLPPMPLFTLFPDQTHLHWAISSYIEMLEIAQAGLQVLAACAKSPIFLRYFHEEERIVVVSVLEAIVGPNGKGPPEAWDADEPLIVTWNPWAQGAYGEQKEICIGTTLGFTIHTRRDGVPGTIIAICPYAASTAQHTRMLNSWTCEALPQTPMIEFEVLSHLLLHEFTHWNVMTDKGSWHPIVDYGYLQGVPIEVEGEPKSGYGAWNTQELNRNFDEDERRPSQNADSYAWFCVEAFFWLNCQYAFPDAPRPQAPPAQSPTVG
jgi:hypothetical protein